LVALNILPDIGLKVLLLWPIKALTSKVGTLTCGLRLAA
jgi:hypothetical protein